MTSAHRAAAQRPTHRADNRTKTLPPPGARKPRAARQAPRATRRSRHGCSTRPRSTACWASTADPADGENRTGIQRIISSGLVSYERLPMLEIVFDRLVRIMSTSLRNFTSDNVEVGIDNILSRCASATT